VTATDQSGQAGGKPTIVLVHGAFADASSWNGVIGLLQQQGYTCIAPANPLRGVTADSAYTVRPIAAAAFSDASGPPAWKMLPCWAVVATGDKAAGADLVRAEAQRAGADIIEVEGSHVIMISQPQAVTDHILKAARAAADSHR